eukprot:gene1320-2542_t
MAIIITLIDLIWGKVQTPLNRGDGAFSSKKHIIPNNKIAQRLPLKLSPDFLNMNDLGNSISSLFHLALQATQADTKVEVVGEVMEQSSNLNILGNDMLIFLFTTIGVVPLFKFLNASPVLGFLAAGLLMGPAGLGLFSDLHDMEALAEFGVLFLLFEQGLELTVDRLKSLSKFAFGMGTLQVLLCTLAFFAFPFVGGVQLLEIVFQAKPDVVDITRVDEALVIGATLSLSSSAFVLKILQEKGQLATKFGSASLGILLLQDIAVVPLLVLLPIIESQSGAMPLDAQLALLGGTFLKAILGLGGILVVGGAVVRYLFSLVAQSKSSETFVALCLLVALGTGALTDALGLSSTLGAFAAGTLLAESNYRTQIEADIKPFRGLLLGLFFLTTGASVDPIVIQEQLPTALGLLTGLIAFKALIITSLGPTFGLSKAESVRTGLILSGGGEFAFVLLTLADRLRVIPDQLAKILVGVVVMSMALTPTLSYLGDKAAEYIEEWERKNGGPDFMTEMRDNEPMEDNMMEDAVVICGFGRVGETVASFLSMSTMMENLIATGGSLAPTKYVAFDLDPDIVMKGNKKGYCVMYGDGSEPLVLNTAGVESPRAVVITYDDDELCFKSVQRLRQAYPTVPIISRANDKEGFFEVLQAGATYAIPDEREASLRMASCVLESLGVDPNDLKELRQESRVVMQTNDEEAYRRFQNKRNDALSNQPKSNLFGLKPNLSFSSAAKNFWGSAQKLVKGDNRGQVIDTVEVMSERKSVTTPSVGGEMNSTSNKAVRRIEDELQNKDMILGVTMCMLPTDSDEKTADDDDDDDDNEVIIVS